MSTPLSEQPSSWQRDVAVVIAAHGDRAGEEPNSLLLKHAAALHRSDAFRLVAAGVLKGSPSIEEALAAARDSGARHVALYPLFMADGYFTRTVLPERVRAAGLDGVAEILQPFGLDPAVPGLIGALARARADAAGWPPAASRLLLVGHGSKLGPASAEATRAAAQAVAAQGQWAAVETAFLEEPPFVADALSGGEAPSVVTGFFSGDGMHAGEDVPAAIRQSAATALYAGSVGSAPEVAAIIGRAIAARFGR